MTIFITIIVGAACLVIGGLIGAEVEEKSNRELMDAYRKQVSLAEERADVYQDIADKSIADRPQIREWDENENW